MNFNEFYARLKNIADTRLDPHASNFCRHFQAQVSASPFGIEWSAYIAGPGYTAGHRTDFPCDPHDPESVLKAAAAMLAAWEAPPFTPEPRKEPAGLADVGEVSGG
jgi:hypothetical protein